MYIQIQHMELIKQKYGEQIYLYQFTLIAIMGHQACMLDMRKQWKGRREFDGRIVSSLTEGTGFKNRGIRINPRLYELRKIFMPAIIVEICFCETTEDILIYREKGPNEIGKLMAEGIAVKKVSTNFIQ